MLYGFTLGLGIFYYWMVVLILLLKYCFLLELRVNDRIGLLLWVKREKIIYKV